MHEPPQFSRSFPPSATFSLYARVKLASGEIAACGASDKGIGIAMRPAFQADVDNDVPIAVALDGPIRKGIASAAITQGNDVFSAASGKLGNTAVGSHKLGVALEAAGADGDIIDYMAELFGAAAT